MALTYKFQMLLVYFILLSSCSTYAARFQRNREFDSQPVHRRRSINGRNTGGSGGGRYWWEGPNNPFKADALPCDPVDGKCKQRGKKDNTIDQFEPSSPRDQHRQRPSFSDVADPPPPKPSFTHQPAPHPPVPPFAPPTHQPAHPPVPPSAPPTHHQPGSSPVPPFEPPTHQPAHPPITPSAPSTHHQPASPPVPPFAPPTHQPAHPPVQPSAPPTHQPARPPVPPFVPPIHQPARPPVSPAAPPHQPVHPSAPHFGRPPHQPVHPSAPHFARPPHQPVHPPPSPFAPPTHQPAHPSVPHFAQPPHQPGHPPTSPFEPPIHQSAHPSASSFPHPPHQPAHLSMPHFAPPPHHPAHPPVSPFPHTPHQPARPPLSSFSHSPHHLSHPPVSVFPHTPHQPARPPLAPFPHSPHHPSRQDTMPPFFPQSPHATIPDPMSPFSSHPQYPGQDPRPHVSPHFGHPGQDPRQPFFPQSGHPSLPPFPHLSQHPSLAPTSPHLGHAHRQPALSPQGEQERPSSSTSSSEISDTPTTLEEKGTMGQCMPRSICLNWQLCKPDGFVISDGTATIENIKEIPSTYIQNFTRCGPASFCCEIDLRPEAHIHPSKRNQSDVADEPHDPLKTEEPQTPQPVSQEDKKPTKPQYTSPPSRFPPDHQDFPISHGTEDPAPEISDPYSQDPDKISEPITPEHIQPGNLGEKYPDISQPEPSSEAQSPLSFQQDQTETPDPASVHSSQSDQTSEPQTSQPEYQDSSLDNSIIPDQINGQQTPHQNQSGVPLPKPPSGLPLEDVHEQDIIATPQNAPGEQHPNLSKDSPDFNDIPKNESMDLHTNNGESIDPQFHDKYPQDSTDTGPLNDPLSQNFPTEDTTGTLNDIPENLINATDGIPSTFPEDIPIIPLDNDGDLDDGFLILEPVDSTTDYATPNGLDDPTESSSDPLFPGSAPSDHLHSGRPCADKHPTDMEPPHGPAEEVPLESSVGTAPPVDDRLPSTIGGPEDLLNAPDDFREPIAIQPVGDSDDLDDGFLILEPIDSQVDPASPNELVAVPAEDIDDVLIPDTSLTDQPGEDNLNSQPEVPSHPTSTAGNDNIGDNNDFVEAIPIGDTDDLEDGFVVLEPLDAQGNPDPSGGLIAVPEDDSNILSDPDTTPIISDLIPDDLITEPGFTDDPSHYEETTIPQQGIHLTDSPDNTLPTDIGTHESPIDDIVPVTDEFGDVIPIQPIGDPDDLEDGFLVLEPINSQTDPASPDGLIAIPEDSDVLLIPDTVPNGHLGEEPPLDPYNTDMHPTDTGPVEDITTNDLPFNDIPITTSNQDSLSHGPDGEPIDVVEARPIGDPDNLEDGFLLLEPLDSKGNPDPSGDLIAVPEEDANDVITPDTTPHFDNTIPSNGRDPFSPQDPLNIDEHKTDNRPINDLGNERLPKDTTSKDPSFDESFPTSENDPANLINGDPYGEPIDFVEAIPIDDNDDLEDGFFIVEPIDELQNGQPSSDNNGKPSHPQEQKLPNKKFPHNLDPACFSIPNTDDTQVDGSSNGLDPIQQLPEPIITPLGTELVGNICSGGVYCVMKEECDPYTGFIIMDPKQRAAVTPFQDTVPLLPCFVPLSNNLQDGVCCQLPHPIAGQHTA